MELRDFAERVLFATTLDDKLQSPEAITDDRPGAPLLAPQVPGRPPELRLKPRHSGKADFPGLRRLEQERERGRLLHVFANHEMLATELMALALLRFPEAPAAFRRGVLQTLRDEQRHTRLYVQRMRQCGIRFGELPVSGYFWRAVAPMESPLDYVAGLCLTFEQANLDFCRHFARGFHAVGDADTAGLLDQIYRDEIGHVAYGLKWFRRWKRSGESDWEAFCRQLKFPLSPQRAKGPTLNVEGRRAAGFDPEFIEELNVYSQSKGRTPSVLVFNPFAEGHIAHGRRFTPLKHQRMLAGDLANLPQFLCRPDDIVLLEKRPSIAFLSAIKQAGFVIPEFVQLKQGSVDPASSLCQRKLGSLRPWAWGPDSVKLLEPLFARVTGETRAASERFNERTARLYSKAWSADFLRAVLVHSRRSEPLGQVKAGRVVSCAQSGDARVVPGTARPSLEPWLCTEVETGVTVDTLEGALDAIAAIRRRGHLQVVAKEAYGLAGHNAIRLWEPELLVAQQRWLAHGLQNGRQLVIEPWLERELDFSVQLEMGPRTLKLCGYTGLINDRRGQFQGNWATVNYDRRIPANVAALFPEPSGILGCLHRLYGSIQTLLETELQRAGYVGPVGIDAFVYRTPQGGCRLKPVVEINPRYTMGRLTLELMKQTSPGSCGLFRLVNRSQARAEGFADLAAYARALSERAPLCLDGEPTARIQAGALCLNEPAQAQVCLATFEVGRTLKSLLDTVRSNDLAAPLPTAATN